MVRKTAMAIIKNIHNDEIDPEDKLTAILEVLRWLVEDYI